MWSRRGQKRVVVEMGETLLFLLVSVHVSPLLFCKGCYSDGREQSMDVGRGALCRCWTRPESRRGLLAKHVQIWV